jgi:mediator of RNA polymerase II transcription subunit 14
LTESFKTAKPLTNRQISRTLRRLNRHLLYRLKCVDHLPPELIIEAVRDGKVYLGHGGEHGWRAHMTVVGFGDGDQARWWLTGVEWGWKTRQKGTDDPGGATMRKLTEEERQQILEVVNGDVLAPRPVETADRKDAGDREKVDSPLNRLFNFLRESRFDDDKPN